MKTKLWQITVILFVIGILATIILSATTVSVATIKGQVVDFGATTDDTGIHSFLLVELEDNRTVKVKYDPASKRNVGKKVVVHERTTKLVGMKKYTIVGWE